MMVNKSVDIEFMELRMIQTLSMLEIIWNGCQTRKDWNKMGCMQNIGYTDDLGLWSSSSM